MPYGAGQSVSAVGLARDRSRRPCPSSRRRTGPAPRPPRRPRCSAASGPRRSRRCGSRTGRSSASPCADRSSGRPCTRAYRTLVFDPWVPATVSVWQPEQRSLNSSAVACCSSGTSIPSSPQAATAPEQAASNVAINSARRALGIGCDSIGERCPGLAPPSRSRSWPSRSSGCGDAGAPVRERTPRLHRHARRLPDPPAGAARPQGPPADGHGGQPRPARPHVPDREGRAHRAAVHDDPAGTSGLRGASIWPGGKYTMYCALANHEELGMYGTLTVG